jgi:hypothetical protein
MLSPKEAELSILADIRGLLTMHAKFVADERSEVAKRILANLEANQPLTAPAPNAQD